MDRGQLIAAILAVVIGVGFGVWAVMKLVMDEGGKFWPV